MKSRRIKVTPELKSSMQAMRDRGKSIAYIAKQHKCSKPTVTRNTIDNEVLEKTPMLSTLKDPSQKNPSLYVSWDERGLVLTIPKEDLLDKLLMHVMKK